MPALLSSAYQEECLWQAQAQMPTVEDRGLPETVDVVVVGAGYCGLSAAISAAAEGASVAVFDSEPLGWGASSRNGGMVIPELKLPPDSLAKKIGPLAYRLYDELDEAFSHIETTAVDSDYSRTGQLLLAPTPRQLAQVRTLVSQLPGASLLTAAEVAERISSPVFVGGAAVEQVGGLHPAKFHAVLARRALAAGVRILDLTGVCAVRAVGSGFEVATTRGTLLTSHVVAATNAYTDAAIPGLAAQVLPISSYMIATEPLPEQIRVRIGSAMMVDTNHLLHYWRLTPDGRMAFGGRRSLDPVDLPAVRDYLYDQMVRVHPILTGVAVEFAWTGYVAMTADRLPHVGTVGGVWFATGCNGSGVCLNTWLGHRLGQVVTGAAAPPAFARLASPNIPAKAMAPVFLPLLGRALAWRDRH